MSTARPLHDPAADALPGAKTEVKTTTCYMCACRCGIRVHLRDSGDGPQVRYIEGNPEHPLNKGILCAKGSSGIMKQYSPARLTVPLRRKPGSERGAGEFEPIGWDECFEILTQRLGHLRATDPKKFALFTGRDQMQALTGLFARQFGTPNYAAHGGFCSVNMAAGMIYTIGGSFWEFGGPDLERAKLFVMIGTAEDHHSNPLKAALSKFKRDGGRFIAINPIRTGYAAIADEWIPIRPGTDGALLLAIIRELITLGLFDREFVARYTNGGQLVNQAEGSDDFGLMMRNPEGETHNPLRPHNFYWWDRHSNSAVADHTASADPRLFGDYQDARRHAGEAGLPVAGRPRQGLHAAVGSRDHRHPGRHHPSPGARDGHDRARPEDRAADRLDRLVGQEAQQGHRQSGGVPRDARAGRAQQRLPDDPRAGDIDEPARHHRPPRGLPPQGALPARRAAQRAPAEGSGVDQAEHATGRTAAGLAGNARRPVRGRRRRAGAHRQGLLVGVPAVGARADAQRHHQRLARRPLPDRHADAVHGQHGLEFQHEHLANTAHAGGQAGRRRIQDPLHRRVRHLPVGNDGLCRPDPARHHLP